MHSLKIVQNIHYSYSHYSIFLIYLLCCIEKEICALRENGWVAEDEEVDDENPNPESYLCLGKS